MKTIATALLLFAGAAQAIGISAEEAQRMKSLSQCAYISNVMQVDDFMTPERISALYDTAVKTFIADSAAMRPGGYNPQPLELVSDYAIYYQQTTSDTESEMFTAIKEQGLPLAPQSWQAIAAQFWVSMNCAAVEKAQ